MLAGALACLPAPGALAQGASVQGVQAQSAPVQGGNAIGGAAVRVGGGTVPSASEGAGGGTTGAAPAVSATVDQCIVGEAADARSVTFTGQMETVPGASRMDMQIVLLEHTHGVPGFHVPAAGGVGAWQRSETGVKIYRYVRQVTDLPAPAVFRALIRYRWLDEAGRVVRSDERRTPVCREPGPASAPGASGSASSPAATMPGA